MIGAMPAVAVRHERRKNKTKDKNNRPNRLLLKPQMAQGGETMSPLGSQAPSAIQSRAGSPTHHMVHPLEAECPPLETGPLRYGDECFYGKVSLLHFIVFFFLGGLTVLIVGAVQFKKEAGLGHLRYHFLVAGAILLALGFALLVIKCACFRIPLPDEYEDEDEFLSPLGEKKNGGGKTNNDQDEVQNDHNHHRESDPMTEIKANDQDEPAKLHV